MHGFDDFQERIRQLQRARKKAREVLDLPANPSRSALRKAWREACKKFHPDMQESPEERRKCKRLFTLSHRAYRCLSEGEDCDKLLKALGNDGREEDANSESPGSDWGYFLRWRERYF